MSLLAWVVGLTKTKLMLISTQVQIVIEVKVEQDVAVVEAGAELCKS